MLRTADKRLAVRHQGEFFVNWEAIGAIAEMIGSLAVLATLAYLAFQVRQASKIAMSSSTNQARAGVSDTLSAISGDTETAKTYTKLHYPLEVALPLEAER